MSVLEAMFWTNISLLSPGLLLMPSFCEQVLVSETRVPRLCKHPPIHPAPGWSMTSGGRARAAAGLGVCWGATPPERSSPIFSSVPNLHSYPPHFSFEDVSLAFLFSPLPVQSHPFLFHLFILSSSFSVVPFLCSHPPLFILSSPPLSSLYYSPSFPHLFRASPSPRPRGRGAWESSLTRNTPTPDSSIFCDGSGGSGSPCAPARRGVRSQTGIPQCCTSPGGSCRSSPWPPSRSRPQISLCAGLGPEPTPPRFGVSPLLSNLGRGQWREGALKRNNPGFLDSVAAELKETTFPRMERGGVRAT